MMEKEYPVSKEVCSKCGACSLVYKSISGAYLDEDNQYYQCISGMERECSERVAEHEREIEEAQANEIIEQMERAEHEKEQEEMEEKEWQAFMRVQNYSQNSMYGLDY